MFKTATAAALAGVFLIVPAAGAQQVMCGGTSNEVCVLSSFTLTNGGNTFNWYAFNGATAASATTQSTVTTLVASLPGVTSSTLLAATFFDGGVGTALSLPADWDDGNGGGQWININLGAEAGGSSGFSTCAGPLQSGMNPTWSTCDRPGAAFGAGWDYMLFSWSLDVALTDSQLSQVAWGWKAQSVGPKGISIECGTSTDILKGGDDHLCGTDGFGTPQETVPEPATMTLLATGLVGLAAARRRRNKRS